MSVSRSVSPQNANFSGINVGHEWRSGDKIASKIGVHFPVLNSPSPSMTGREKPAFDMNNRDPNEMNTHLQVMWDDLVAEPEGIRSADCIWKASYKIFRCSQCCCYNLMAAIFFIPTAFVIGLRFACLSFMHIWCLTPLVRDMRLNCLVCRTMNAICCDTIIGPIWETMGLLFSRFRFTFITQKATNDRNDNNGLSPVEPI